MIGGDGVAQVQQHLGVLDGTSGRQIPCHAVEIRWLLDVCRGVGPGIEFSSGGRKALPVGGTGFNFGIYFLEHSWNDVFLLHRMDFRSGWPDVSQKHV